MKKLIALLLAAILLLPVCGCEDEAGTSDTVSGTTTQASEATTTDVSTTTILSSTKTTTTPPSKTTTSTTGTTTRPPSKNPQRLPEVTRTALDMDIRYTDIAKTDNGFAVVGEWGTKEWLYSLLEVYDENALLKSRYANPEGNGFTKLAVCSDGGYLASSYSPPMLTKLSRELEREWVADYENFAGQGNVHDIEEIQPGLYAVLFVSNLTEDWEYTFKITFVSGDGTVIETIQLMRWIEASDADLIADGEGGFYLTASVDHALADDIPLLEQVCDPQKGGEAIVLRFSSDRKPIWATALGGYGTDWCEEGAADSDGNLYLAIGTHGLDDDPFWPISVNPMRPYRRMLVKLNPDGDILYKVPLSSRGMAVDQVFSIQFSGKQVFVVGMSDYFDSIQSEYPCEQILASESDNWVPCVYTACIQPNGSVYDCKLFRCDINDTPTGAAVLSDGSIVICGSVSAVCNPFNLFFATESAREPALFLYEPFLI